MSPLTKVHAAAGGLAILTILGLQAFIAWREASGYPADLAATRTAALWVVGLVLIPALAAAGGSGGWLGRGWRGPVVATKLARMKAIAAIGILVLVPLAIGLWFLASQGWIDGRYHLLTRIETFAALINVLLLGLNLRDGLRMRRPRPPCPDHCARSDAPRPLPCGGASAYLWGTQDQGAQE